MYCESKKETRVAPESRHLDRLSLVNVKEITCKEVIMVAAKSKMYKHAHGRGAYHNPVKEPCFFCGEEKGVERHHPDYTKPREIVWLCKEHHLYVHKNTEIIYPYVI